MITIYTIIAYWSWAVLWLVWAIGLFKSKKNISWPNRGGQIIVTLLLIACFSLLFNANDFSGIFGTFITPRTQLFGWIGLVLDLLGVGFAILARISLGRNWSGVITLKKDHELVEKGPYAFVRHPIYTGFVFAVFGTALTIGTLAGYIGFLCGLIGLLIRVKEEDVLMAKQFPETHPAYRARTKKLIPFVW